MRNCVYSGRRAAAAAARRFCSAFCFLVRLLLVSRMILEIWVPTAPIAAPARVKIPVAMRSLMAAHGTARVGLPASFGTNEGAPQAGALSGPRTARA